MQSSTFVSVDERAVRVTSQLSCGGTQRTTSRNSRAVPDPSQLHASVALRKRWTTLAPSEAIRKPQIATPIPAPSASTQLAVDRDTKASHRRGLCSTARGMRSGTAAQAATASFCTGFVSQQSASSCAEKQRVTAADLKASTERMRRRMLVPPFQLWIAHRLDDSTAMKLASMPQERGCQ